MATDKPFYEYAVRFPKPLAKLIQADADEYEAKSLTLKATEKRPDIFLIGQSGNHVILVETQGYDDAYLYHRMIATKMLYCIQFKYTGKMEAVAIFLDESHYRAAELFHQQFDASASLKFSPKTIVFSRIKVDELKRLGDIHLIPFYPLCDISPQEVQQQAPDWAETIKAAPDLQDDERKNLLEFLGGFISHRIKTLSKEFLTKLLGGFAMEDTRVGQEIMQLGAQRLLFKLIAARFGQVPEDIRQKIQMASETENLERIATALLTIQSVDELKNLVN